MRWFAVRGRAAAVLALLFVLVMWGSGGAVATREPIVEDTLPLAPLAPDSAILVTVNGQLIIPRSPVLRFPQGGTWFLDWGGGGGLPAGHYEGLWTCYTYAETIQLEPTVMIVAPVLCRFAAPDQGVVLIDGVITQTGGFFPCGSFGEPRAEWKITIRATGLFADLTDLSGDAVAIRTC